MKMHALRWFLLAPASIFAWFLVSACGLAAYAFIEGRLCPPLDVVSGLCANPSVHRALVVLEHVAAALSAIAVLATASAIAPSHKGATLWVAFLAGTAAALILALATSAWSLLLAAISGGILGSYVIARLIRRSTDGPPDGMRSPGTA